jgi:hypothetical protein
MRKPFAAAFSVLALVGAVATASAEVRLTIQGGHVTLVAKDATIRQILAEWERVGQTKVVNAERIGGGPLTLELTDVPELQALDVVLRSVSGVVLAPRATADGNVSAFERIVVVPTSTAPAQAVDPPPPVFGPPRFPQQVPPFPSDDQDPAALNRGAVFTFPPPQVTNPQGEGGPMPGIGINPNQPQQPPLFRQQTAPAAPVSAGSFPGGPSSSTSSPTGVPVPGMVAPAPAPGPPGFPQPAPPQK